ncbi:hypothetical protein LSH36_219g03059 [Paralvinella palmiformis]|uniref:PDZ domain-containing protein n=1 Tax=Paralvinella palmiformis TaxID=53620 RepID=A0AAD9JNB6_9ANNE|nr:hypothetical protein LSH36_219g03059 [Paralvinella palmiformis]
MVSAPTLGRHLVYEEPVDDEMTADLRPKPSANVSRLQDTIHYLLNEQEQAEFRQIINDYHGRRNVNDFCHALTILLDTPAKREITKHLRKIIRKADAARFDQYMSSVSASAAAPSPPTGVPSRQIPASNGLLAQWETKSLPRRFPGQYATIGHRPRGSASVVSAPAYQFATLPHPGSRVIKRPMAHTDFLGAGRTSAPEWEIRAARVKRVVLEQPANPTVGLGFSIRGGAEHGIGIYVSYVDTGSVAERQGLEPGDQIISVNGLSFRKITHKEAAKIVKASHTIDMEVRHVGRIPGSFETHQSYTWVDEFGRTVSPPPEVDQSGRYNTADGRKSGLMLLKDTDERKVNLVVSESKTLGISIRGGNEFGLGIYITQADSGSPADNAGLKVSSVSWLCDQILDVNGRTFLDISHGDAVKALKSSKHLMITVKDVGKLPYTRTTYDHTQWISDDELALTSRHDNKGTDLGTVRSETSSLNGRFTALQINDSMFSRGAGSQLMHNSMMSHNTQMALIDESARCLLNDNQHAALKYYIDDYQKGFIQVEALLLALFEILNTKTKFALLTDIRGIIHPKDIKTFDHLVLQKEVTLLKSKSMETLYPLPRDSDDDSLGLSHSHYGWPTTSVNQVTTQASEEEMEALRKAIELIDNDRIQERKTQKKGRRLKIGLGRKNFRCPSEDSGVELNGSQNTSINQHKDSRPRGNDSANGYRGKYMSLGRKNAYSLIDTPISNGSHQDPMLSSLSDLEDRMDMFKTLPAQFESEMVHANIQTDEDWSHVSSGFGSSQERPSKASTSRRMRLYSASSECELRNVDPSMGHLNGERGSVSSHQMSPASGMVSVPDRWGDAGSEESPYANVGRPRKPPRSYRSINRSRSAEGGDPEETRSTSSNIPSINLDHPPPSEQLGAWESDSRMMEPLSIVPPPPSPDDPATSSATVDVNHYKLFDIPFDDVDIGYTAAPPSETSLQLSPIAIVPPPPPMDSTFGTDDFRLDPDDQSGSKSTSDRSPDQVTSPSGQISPTDNGELKSIVVHKTRPTLGLAIEGGANTRQPLPRIINIQPDGAAARCNDLSIGDIIVKVNGQSLEGKLHRQCAKIIATAFKDKQTDTLTLGVMKCARKMKV